MQAQVQVQEQVQEQVEHWKTTATHSVAKEKAEAPRLGIDHTVKQCDQ